MDSGGPGSIASTSSVGDSGKAEWGEQNGWAPPMANLGRWCWGLVGPQHSEAHPAIWASGECAQVAHSPGRTTSPSPDSQVPDSRTAQNLAPSQMGRWVLGSQHAFLGQSQNGPHQGSKLLPRPCSGVTNTAKHSPTALD